MVPKVRLVGSIDVEKNGKNIDRIYFLCNFFYWGKIDSQGNYFS